MTRTASLRLLRALLILPGPGLLLVLGGLLILANEFHTRDGEHLAYAATFREGLVVPEGHCLIWGPYVTLGPGHYDFEVVFEPRSEEFELCYDVAADSGRRVLGAGVIRIESARFPRFLFLVHEQGPCVPANHKAGNQKGRAQEIPRDRRAFRARGVRSPKSCARCF